MGLEIAGMKSGMEGAESPLQVQLVGHWSYALEDFEWAHPAWVQLPGSDIQWETMGKKFPGYSRFPGNGREKFEPREFLSYGNFPWLEKFTCNGKFLYP